MKTTMSSTVMGAGGTRGLATVKSLIMSAVWPLMIAGTIAVMAGVIMDSDRAIFFGSIVAIAGAVISEIREGGER